MEDMDRSVEGYHEFAVISSKLSQGTRLMLENLHDRVDRIAIFELLGERMVDQLHPCLFLVVLQGGVEEELKASGRRVAHFTDGRTADGSRGICVMEI
jgi:hypothetical protein